MPSSEASIPGLGRWTLGLLTFAVPVLAALGWAEWRLRQAPSSYSLKRAGFEAAAPELQVLVLGASEAHQGASTDAMGRPGYNLANVGQGLREDQAILQAAVARAPKLRWALLGLSFQSLGYRLQGSPEAWRSFLYERHFGVPPAGPEQWLDLRRSSALLFYGIRPGLRHLAGAEPLPVPALAADGHEGLACLDEDAQEMRLNAMVAARRAADHRRLVDPAAMPENLARLEAMRLQLQQAGAGLVVFLPPVTAAYAEALDPALLAAQRQALRAWSDAAGVPVLDHFRDPAFADADFSDVDHLCAQGADKLSKRLGAELKGLEGARP